MCSSHLALLLSIIFLRPVHVVKHASPPFYKNEKQKQTHSHTVMVREAFLSAGLHKQLPVFSFDIFIYFRYVSGLCVTFSSLFAHSPTITMCCLN